MRPFEKGKLFVHFTVKFPEPGDLSDEVRRCRLKPVFAAWNQPPFALGV